MHETMDKVKKLCRIEEKLTSWICEEMEKGRDGINTKEAGEVVDMIKDIAKAKKECWEACYYKSIVEAMEEAKEEDSDRMGYDTRRYASGRYAPSGRGHYSPVRGFMPMKDVMKGMQGWEDEWTNKIEARYDNPRMGYDDRKMDRDRVTDGRYGYSYENYRSHRKNYDDTHNQKDKDEMDTFAREHISDTITTMRDIWNHADPGMKQRMKTDLSNLIGEMNS